MKYLSIVILIVLNAFYHKTGTANVKDFGAVGDGLHHDDSAIVKAIAYLNSLGGGTLIFPTGSYKIVHANTAGEAEYVITIPDNIVVQATGATIGSTQDGAFCFRTVGNNISWTGGTIKKGGFEICSSYVTLTGIRSDSSWGHAFHLSSGKGNNIVHTLYRNITVQNCMAYYSGRHGFAMHRKNAGFGPTDSAFLGEYYNIKFTKDTAINAGSSLTSPYDYGFGMENIIKATNVTFKNCYSFQSQGAGFHVEYQILCSGIAYVSCLSRKNGLSTTSGYPYGFMYRDAGFTINDCQTDSNYGGAYVQITSFTGGQVNFVYSGEKGYTRIYYNDTSADNRKFITNFAGYAVPACGTIYLGGNPTIPMKCLRTDLIPIQNITETFVDTTGHLVTKSHYAAVTKQLTYDPDTRPTSIATQPIKIDTSKQYQIKVSIREVSGTMGNPYLYMQEFDKNCKLLTRGGKRYSIQSVIAGLSQTIVSTATVYFGKGTAVNFNPNTVWVRVSLNEDELSTDNKFYSLSQFSVIPL